MKSIRLLFLCLLTAVAVHAAPKSAPVSAVPQSGSACGTGVAHCVVLTWAASSSAATCVSPCTLTYNVYGGTAAGAEDFVHPVNGPTIITGLTFTYPVTLTSTPQTFYFVVEAVETSGGIAALSVPSTEVSATFPGTPAAPTGVTATKQ